MRPGIDRPPRGARGFALVLALMTMALAVLAVLALSGLLRLESRGVGLARQAGRARLNARMAGRLALAHLQQEAGPDRRATATGDLAGLPARLPSPYPAGTEVRRRLGQGQARWTGVWRSDRPDQPPAWLISGKGRSVAAGGEAGTALAQSRSLSGALDYDTGQWAPWQTDFPATTDAPLAVLVGDGSAGLDPGPDGSTGTADDEDHRIALPWTAYPGNPTGPTLGGFAYWVGDEGVKVRVNLPEPRDLAGAAPGNLDAVDALRAPARAGTKLLRGLGDVDDLAGLAAADPGSVRCLPGYAATEPGLRLPVALATFHEHSYRSAGVLADSYRGGLRRDLSLAFEMDDREFDRSEYGDATGEPDGAGAATELHTGTPGASGGTPNARASWFPRFPSRPESGMTSLDPRPRVWVPLWEPNPDNPGRLMTTTGDRYKAWSPVFARDDEMGTAPREPLETPNYNLDPPFPAPRRAVGPLWHLVRDHYRLYKELTWTDSGPVLEARAAYPNIHALTHGGYRPDPGVDPFSRFDLDHAFWSNGGYFGDRLDPQGTSPDPMGVLNPRKEHRFIPRAVRGAYLPTLHRVALVLSVKKVAAGRDCTLRLLCTPLVALHNPYGVSLRLRAPDPANEPDGRVRGAAARVGFSGLNDLKVCLRAHVDNDPMNPASETRGTRLDHAFGIRAATADADDENFGALIPDTILRPGETLVFSSRQALPARELAGPGGPVLRLEPGLHVAGGFHADLATVPLSAAGNPDHRFLPRLSRFLGPGVDPARPAGDGVEAWFSATGMRWRPTLHLCSFRRQSRAGDRMVGHPPLEEVLGARRAASRASLALMVNLGDFDPDAGLLLGDPGSEARPVRLGPMANLRDADETDLPGAVIGVIDTRARVADEARRTSFDRVRLPLDAAQAHPVPAAHPNWLVANPLAQTSNSPGHVFAGFPGSPEISTSIGSPARRTQFLGGDELAMNGASVSWSNLIEVEPTDDGGARAFGGASHGATGGASVLHVDIPLAAPLGIGQLMHANVGVWPWFPYHTVGNSFAPVASPRDKSWIHGVDPNPSARKGGHTLPDMAYLMNQALWDGFFLSGAAPRLTVTRRGDYAAVRARTAQEVLDAFAAGEGRLGNVRLRLHRPAGRPAPETAFAAPGFHAPVPGEAPSGHRRLAAYLLNDGAFNVNSTSVEAWTGLLGSLRGVGVGALPPGGDRHPFPRVLSGADQPVAGDDLRDDAYWRGFVALTDIEVRELAAACVAEVRARARSHQRTERDQEYPPRPPPGAKGPRRFRGFPDGLEPGTPFLGLTEFVNRHLGPTKQVGAHVGRSFFRIRPDGRETPMAGDATGDRRWLSLSGTLEAALGRTALARAPAHARTIVTAISHDWNHATSPLAWGGGGSRTGMPLGYFHANLEVPAPLTRANRTHTGFGAVGCLFQADLLQALGACLATRSDTFVIRAAGTASLGEGDRGAPSVVLELVVQRLPDYVDPRDAPETAPTDPALRAANRALGRRFRVVAARWLAPDRI